jgi:Protein of unknown function (DUF3106)
MAALVMWMGLVMPGYAFAQGAGPGPNWAQLTPAQQGALAPLRNDWDSLDAGRKQKWLEVASRFGQMSPQRQQRVRERMTEWARLSPSQRTEARINYQQSKQVAPEDRQARWEAYQALSSDERAALAARANPAVPGASQASPAQTLRRAPVDALAPKSNLVAPTRSVPAPKPVAPTIVQGNPGATTRLVTATPKPPPYQQPGQPKIAATPKQVDKTTLLPKTGPQAAGIQPIKPNRVAPGPATRAPGGASSSAQ